MFKILDVLHVCVFGGLLFVWFYSGNRLCTGWVGETVWLTWTLKYFFNHKSCGHCRLMSLSDLSLAPLYLGVISSV